jgi:hypothetical protein
MPSCFEFWGPAQASAFQGCVVAGHVRGRRSREASKATDPPSGTEKEPGSVVDVKACRWTRWGRVTDGGRGLANVL